MYRTRHCLRRPFERPLYFSALERYRAELHSVDYDPDDTGEDDDDGLTMEYLYS